MTISQEERQRLIIGSEDTVETQPRFERSPIVAALMGMLAGLGMIVLIGAGLTAGALLLNVGFDLVIVDAGVQELSFIGVGIAAVVILASTLIGGFVAGRLARYGGLGVGIGSSLWLTLALALLTGLGMWAATVTDVLDGVDVGIDFSRITTSDLTTGAAIAAGGLFVVALLGGLLGGRFGQTERSRPAPAIVDLREMDETSETSAADERTSV